MRLAVYYLTAVIVAIVVVGMIGVGAGLTVHRPSSLAKRQPQRHEVFVDVDRLVAMHPDLDVVRALASAIDDVRAAQAGVLRGGQSSKQYVTDPVTTARALVPRWKLEDAAAQRADEALKNLEDEQREALRMRVQISRMTMVDSAKPDIKMRSQEIEQESSSKIRETAQRFSSERLNLQMNVGALKLALGKPGLDEAQTQRKLDAARERLEQIDQTVADETKEVTAQARKAINDLRTDANVKIDTALAAYEASETRKIEARISNAQNLIMTDVCSFDESNVSDVFGCINYVPGDGKSLALVYGARVGPEPVYSAAGDEGDWRADMSALRQRIRDGVVSAVRKLADERGVNVVFARNGKKTPDETASFAETLKERDWRVGEPVLFGKQGTGRHGKPS